MTDFHLRRTLWYQEQSRQLEVKDPFLVEDARSLIVLGEAGMGKSHLLKKLSKRPGYALCTANTLISAPDTTKKFSELETLLVDALDEVSSRTDGDPVNDVISKLAQFQIPRFILSCRVADWSGELAVETLAGVFGTPPLELHLNPLGRDDAKQILEVSLGVERAEEVIVHLEGLGLSGLWSNPQTLSMVRNLAINSILPNSKGELFQRATELLASEHNEKKDRSELAKLSNEEVLNAAGCGFSALILTGNEALSVAVNYKKGDVRVSEISKLTSKDNLRNILNSRLFASLGTKRFTHSHRSIGEFVGARWLAKACDTKRKRRHLHELFKSHKLVPANLRGIYAWLAWHCEELADEIIQTDPMCILEYGDPAKLSPHRVKKLLDRLQTEAQEDRNFRRWEKYREGWLVDRSLLPTIKDLLESPHTASGLKSLVLEVLKNSPLMSDLHTTFEKMILDGSQPYITRRRAIERLIEADKNRDWSGDVAYLSENNTEDSVRLAMEVMAFIGYAHFETALLLDVVIKQLPWAKRTFGLFYNLERNLRGEQLDRLLDGITGWVNSQGDKLDRTFAYVDETTDLAYGLIAQRLRQGTVEAERLWAWLNPLYSRHGFHQETRKALADRLERDPELKRDILRLVMLELPGDASIPQRFWSLVDSFSRVQLRAEDLVTLLDHLDLGDDRWLEIASIAYRWNLEPNELSEVRQALERFVGHDPKANRELHAIENPATPEWAIRDQKRRQDEEAERERSWVAHRETLGSQIDTMRLGDYGLVLNPAMAYLKLYREIGTDTSDGPSLIEEWLGQDLRDASLMGFEAFLQTTPPIPSATQIAEAIAQGRRWDAGYIITAALAERLRTGRGFADLPTERLMAGYFETRYTHFDEKAGVGELRHALTDLLRAGACWEDTQRLYFEPQFAADRAYVDGLYQFLRDDRDRALALRLSLEWIERYPDLPEEPEAELLDLLVSEPDFWPRLAEVAMVRNNSQTLSKSRRRNWDAIRLVVKFEEAKRDLKIISRDDRDLIWRIRDRIGLTRGHSSTLKLATDLLVWIFEQFRVHYPLKRRPNRVTTGDTNSWDASEFLVSIISRIADDTTDQAMKDLTRLCGQPRDGYTEHLRALAADQRRKKAEREWSAPNIEDLAFVICDEPPKTIEQLQAVILEELIVIQAKLRGSNIDDYKDFFLLGSPRNENQCRDQLLKMLSSQLPFGIAADPEGHLADDKICDIICSLGKNLMLPIEIKGQWHRDLWTAADDQLGRLYANDWRADQRGIYLVFWFGVGSSKKLTPPPKRGTKPKSAEELKEALTKHSAAAMNGSLAVVVLDLERPRT
jgi:hypothetical protein